MRKSDMTKYEQYVSELTAVVKKVLSKWDPMCVEPGKGPGFAPLDEYDEYAEHFVKCFEMPMSPMMVSIHLHTIRVVNMGFHDGMNDNDRLYGTKMYDAWEEVRGKYPKTFEVD